MYLFPMRQSRVRLFLSTSLCISQYHECMRNLKSIAYHDVEMIKSGIKSQIQKNFKEILVVKFLNPVQTSKIHFSVQRVQLQSTMQSFPIFKRKLHEGQHFCLLQTRKYPLRGYILGVLTHTTAWDLHWRGDETLKVSFDKCRSALPRKTL